MKGMTKLVTAAAVALAFASVAFAPAPRAVAVATTSNLRVVGVFPGGTALAFDADPTSVGVPYQVLAGRTDAMFPVTCGVTAPGLNIVCAPVIAPEFALNSKPVDNVGDW